jgi:hypothetical protein
MRLFLLDTFYNIEEMVEAVCELHGKQELELHSDGILKLVSGGGGLKQYVGDYV